MTRSSVVASSQTRLFWGEIRLIPLFVVIFPTLRTDKHWISVFLGIENSVQNIGVGYPQPIVRELEALKSTSRSRSDDFVC